MGPERSGLEVTHNEASLPELSRNLEDEALFMLFDLGGIHDAIEAEMSPGRGNGFSAEFVVDDLAPGSGEHVDRVSPGASVDGDSENEF